MNANRTHVEPRAISRLIESGETDREQFEHDVHEGLAKSSKSLPSVYFYDERGSALFRQITELPEYYLTRVEREILERHGDRIGSSFKGGSCDVVDLGAGDGSKSRVLLQHLHDAHADVRYFPIDVSEAALRSVLTACASEQPWLDAEGILAEYTQGIRWLGERDARRRLLVLMLGSNIGNMGDASALVFLRALRDALRPRDCVLIGFDLMKDPAVLARAYDDAAGVTREFNLNLLRRINGELEGTFDIDAFTHHAMLSPSRRAMESYLLSERAQSVRVSSRSFEFAAWEPINTEISKKYRESDVESFARASGFDPVALYFDERRFFVDALFRVGSAAKRQ